MGSGKWLRCFEGVEPANQHRKRWLYAGWLRWRAVALREDALSKELLVAREILLASREGHQVHFDLLVDRLKGRKLAGRDTVSTALDMLFGQGLVTAEWATTQDGFRVRAFRVAGEARRFVERIVEETIPS